MEKLTQRVLEMIRRYEMIREGECILAGVSGGADSVCLLYVLAALRNRLGFSLQVLHVEHGIRGEESREDAAFVQRLCSGWEIGCRVVSVDAASFARERKWSLEEAARFLRYRALEKEARRLGSGTAAVAHHSGDQAETFLLNLTRGSALKGLCAMRPVSSLPWSDGSLRLIRPLLGVSREEIEKALTAEQIPWRTDSSNLTAEAARNRIRLKVMPYLNEEINALSVQHICEAAFRLQEAEDYIRRQAEAAGLGRIRHTGGTLALDLEGLQTEERILLEYILREFLKRGYEELDGQGRDGWFGLKDVNRRHFEALLSLVLERGSRACDLPGGIRVQRRGTSLEMITGEKQKPPRQDPVWLSVPEREGEAVCVFREPYRFEIRVRTGKQDPQPSETRGKTPGNAGTDAENEAMEGPMEVWRFSLERESPGEAVLCLRTRQEGDYLVIDREGHRQSLKKYMINEKIPRQERDRRLLLAQGSHVWKVLGGRRSEAVRPGPDAKRLLEIAVYSCAFADKDT